MTTQAHGVIPEFTLGDRLRKARELTGLECPVVSEDGGAPQPYASRGRYCPTCRRGKQRVSGLDPELTSKPDWQPKLEL